MSGEPRSSPRRLAAVERQRQALELRKEGYSFFEIAQRLGYSGKGAAHKAVTTGLMKTLREPAEALRHLEDERLDAALRGIWSRVVSGDLGAISALLRIADVRMKLWGLATPVETRVAGPAGGPIPVEDVALSDDERAARVIAILTEARLRLVARGAMQPGPAIPAVTDRAPTHISDRSTETIEQ